MAADRRRRRGGPRGRAPAGIVLRRPGRRLVRRDQARRGDHPPDGRGMRTADRRTGSAAVNLDPRTPVIVGVGQSSERLGEPGYRRRSPVDLSADAAADALADTGAEPAAVAAAIEVVI